MNKLVVAFVSMMALISSNAQAKPLWSNLTTDMTEADVKALYPPTKGLMKYVRVDLGDDCVGDLQFEYRDGKLSKVLMTRSEKAYGKCEGLVVRGLEAKYGQPDAEDLKVKGGHKCGSGAIGNLCKLGNNEDGEVRRYKTWKLADGVEVRLRTTDFKEYLWRVEWVDVAPVSDSTLANL